MNKFLLFLLGLFLSSFLFADPVDEATTLRVAEQWYQAAIERHEVTLKSEVRFEITATIEGLLNGDMLPIYRVVSAGEDNGYIIISADNQVLPILSYALYGNYVQEVQSQPEPFRKWMEFYKKQIKTVVTHDIPAGEEVTKTWEAYLNGDFEKTLDTVNPLVSTRWDQPFPYNALCPQDPSSGQRAVVGCVATAMAQIMRYHAHPAQGTGFHSYNHPQFGTVSANFGSTTYNWANMPNQVSSFNQDVALLSYHCGVSIEMGYGVQVSGVSSLSGVASALKQYFSYSSTTSFVQRSSYSDASWIQLMKDELDNARPIEYAGIGQGGGHAWVADGYDINDFFHMNWGWGGYQDGYFTLNNLNPAVGGTGAGNSGFNSYQQAVIGIQPAGGGNTGGGNDPDPTEYDNLVMWSGVSANPFPIAFAQAFEVSVSVANTGNEPVTGDIAAAIFTEDGTFLDFIDTETGTLDNGFFYNLTFNNDGLPTSPGNYLMGFFYRPTGGEYTIIPAGDYANPINFEIQGPANNIALYDEIQTQPQPIVAGEPFQISVDYANFGTFDYSGEFSMDLYTLEGEYVQEIEVLTADLCANCHFTSGLNFSSQGIDVEPGTYLVATWNRPAGGEWQIVGTGDFENPVRVQVQAPAIVGDPFENNNSLATAFDINPLFFNNIAYFESDGSNMHVAEDEDYFKIDLEEGYQYTITARVHDSFDSGNGNSYTNDVLFGINDGSEWSELFDDTMDSPFTITGGGTITFGVSSYFVGTLGSYLLEVEVERSIDTNVEQEELEPFVTIGPNPSQRYFDLALDLEASATVRADLYAINGKVLSTVDFGLTKEVRHRLDMEGQAAGTYILLLDVDGIQYRRRLVLTK